MKSIYVIIISLVIHVFPEFSQTQSWTYLMNGYNIYDIFPTGDSLLCNVEKEAFAISKSILGHSGYCTFFNYNCHNI